MTSSSVSQDQNPILTFEGKRYDLNKLPDDLKELVRGMQVADAQLRMHEDTLKVLAVGRQSMAMQLNDRLKEVNLFLRAIEVVVACELKNHWRQQEQRHKVGKGHQAIQSVSDTPNNTAISCY